MTLLEDGPSAPEQSEARIPPIVDVDAHVVEPPGVWSTASPRSTATSGPRIEHLPAGTPNLAGGSYIEQPGTEGPTSPGGTTRTTATR